MFKSVIKSKYSISTFRSNKEGLFTTSIIPSLILQLQEAPSLPQGSVPEIFLRTSALFTLSKEFILSYNYLSLLKQPSSPCNLY